MQMKRDFLIPISFLLYVINKFKFPNFFLKLLRFYENWWKLVVSFARVTLPEWRRHKVFNQAGLKCHKLEVRFETSSFHIFLMLPGLRLPVFWCFWCLLVWDFKFSHISHAYWFETSSFQIFLMLVSVAQFWNTCPVVGTQDHNFPT